MTFIIGLLVTFGSLFGGYAAMGGHMGVIWQPWEYVIIGGSAVGIFIIANQVHTIKDTGSAIVEAILDRGPHEQDYLDLLGLLHSLMREMRTKGKTGLDSHIEVPAESEIFKKYPKVLSDASLAVFICDDLPLRFSSTEI